MSTTENVTKAPTTANAAGVLKRSSSYSIDPQRVTRRAGWNPRIDFGEIDLLARSIKDHGMLQAIRVKRIKGNPDADFELIDGDRRLTAVETLLKRGHVFPDGIPAIIVDAQIEDVKALIQMFEANTGKAFTPIEEAQAYKRMRDAGMSLKQICASVSRAQVHVSAMLDLLGADDSVKEAATDGTVGKTLAKKIATAAKGDKAKQKELVAQAKAAGKDKTKRRMVEKEIDKAHRAKAAKKGVTLKMRALSDKELSELGTKQAQRMVEHLQGIWSSLDMDVHKTLAQIEIDDADTNESLRQVVAIAYTLGTLDALKAAAGVEVNLTLGE